MPIDYEEMASSPTENFGDDGFTAQRILRCDWADRLALAAELRGGLSGGTWTPPAEYPHRTAAVARTIAIAPQDEDRPLPLAGDTTKASYAKALLTVGYAVPTISNTGDGTEGNPVIVFEETIEAFGEFLTQNPFGLAWGSPTGDLLTQEEAPAKLLRGLTWVYTRHFLTSVPAAILDLPGCVNNASMSAPSLGLTFAAETLLFNPPLLARQISSDGTATVSLTYRFGHKKHTWNKFWRDVDQDYVEIFDVESGDPYKPYPPASFVPLIT
jgi:hypothetical protein